MFSRLSLIGLSAVGLLASLAPAFADCTGLPALRMKPVVDSFLIRPESLLDRNPFGSAAMSATISSLVASDPDRTLKLVLKLLGRANRYQEQSIGTGIGRAARLCASAQQPWKARQLEQQPLLNDNRVAMAAFIDAYRGTAPDAPGSPVPEDEPAKRLDLGGFSSPSSNVFKGVPVVSDPLKPIR